MHLEKQRIAIAEACGWGLVDPFMDNLTAEPGGLINPEGKYVKRFWREGVKMYFVDILSELPDYLNDLNDCHEMEKTLHDATEMKYQEQLFDICYGFPGTNVWQATARQRCEAFLKTIGKWEEDSKIS